MSDSLRAFDISTSYGGRRICQVINLRSEHVEEYKKVHAEAWETVLSGLRRAHIVDYSIHFLPSPPYPSTPGVAGLLIAHFKYVGTDFEGDIKVLAEDDDTRHWWKVTDPMQSSFVDGATGSSNGPWWLDLKEVFRFDG